MDLRSDRVQWILSKYKFHDVATEELNKINRIYPDLRVTTGIYVFSDSTQRELLKLIGNIPVRYDGQVYNFPIQMWLLDSFPFTPPICLLRPTANMVIREGKHVDSRGRIHLPGLHGWDYPKSSVVPLLSEMIAKFEEDPPLSSKSPEGSNPQDLLAMVSSFKIYEGEASRRDQPVTKVSLIGGGDLAMATVMSILAKGCVDKLVLVDVTESSGRVGGSGSSSSDLEMFSMPKLQLSRDLAASAGSRVVVLTANAWSGEQSYVGVVQTNVDLYRGLIPSLAQLSPNAVLLVASQPVDIMTHVAWKQSGFPPTRVIGAGCNLDSERLAYTLDIHLNTHQQAWVIGEMSDNKVPVMSSLSPSSSMQPEIAQGSTVLKPLLDRAMEMTKNRGQRSWSVGLSIADIINTIVTDRSKVHSVSTLAMGWGGIGAEVFLSLPCLLGSNGSMRLAGASLGMEEDAKVKESIASLVNLMAKLRI